jgi:hypothetical protein
MPVNPAPTMPCLVILAGRPYSMGSSFHAFVDDVIAMERELEQVRANYDAAKSMAKRAFDELTKVTAARAEAERDLTETKYLLRLATAADGTM